MTLHTSTTTSDDLADVASRLRWADVVEITRSTKTDALSVLQASAASSRHVQTIWTERGERMALVGVRPTPNHTNVGILWLLGTPLVEAHPLALLRLAPQVLGPWEQEFPDGFQNYVDAENRLARRWLRLLGFVELLDVQVNSFPFIHVYRHV